MSYKNFKLAIYCPVWNLNNITDFESLDKDIRFLEKHLNIDKVYLETFRSMEIIEKDKLIKIKEFFNKRGIKTSGGITTAAEERTGAFDSLCYTTEADRILLKETVEFTASIFDEIILDDFYFTNCKCESCINAKGDRSWSEFRLKLLKNVSEELVIGPAKAVNPNINMIIKYPNWYEHFQETGYNLEDEPHQFDMLYTGTETRDPQHAQQHIPRYLSYFFMRYIENIKPGKNGGGWFDPFECSYNLNAYVEQARLTLFSKAREVTLFCLSALLQEGHSLVVPLVGHVFNTLDKYLGYTGNPIGTAAYIPYHSSGEDYLHNYVGMLGIPLEAYPEFPYNSSDIFLTEGAAKDKDILNKIHQKLLDGGNVTITSGLVNALAQRGFDQLANIKLTNRKFIVDHYGISHEGIYLTNSVYADKSIVLTQLDYCVNDTWELIAGMGNENNLPVLLKVNYGKGKLFVLNIPDDFGDLYHYPREVLNIIRNSIGSKLPVQLNSESKVGLFVYDNNTFFIESFLPSNKDIKVIVNHPNAILKNPVTSQEINGITENNRTIFALNIAPLSCNFFNY